MQELQEGPQQCVEQQSQQHRQQHRRALLPPPQTAEELATALHDAVDLPVHRRLLRFIFGGLVRRRGQRREQHRLWQQQRKQLLQAQQQDAQQLYGDFLCGTSDDGTEECSEDVLGMSPFASCADLQDYRAQLQLKRQQRLEHLQAAQQQRRQGPIRRVLQWLVRGARAVACHVGPQGPGENDSTLAERVFNVLTSVPFIAVGMHSLRSEGTGPKRRRFGMSFIATGIIAATYHATPAGRARALLRKLDYYSICLTSSVLRAATGLHVPMLVNLAAALVTPLKPTLVTSANLAAVEVRYLASALQHAHLRPMFGAHLGAAATGVGFFLLEDVMVIKGGAPPVFHSMWHTLSALSMGLMGPLLSHVEGALLLEGVQMMVVGR